MHYRLGLVCSRCLCHSTITSEAMQHHGQICIQHTESDAEDEDGDLTMTMHPHQADSTQAIP